MPYIVDWERLRRDTRIERGDRSYREFVACLPGLNVSTMHRFLNGAPLELSHLLLLMTALQSKPEEIIYYEYPQGELPLEL